MNFEDIVTKISESFGESVIEEKNEDGLMPFIVISKEKLLKVCSFLHETEGLYFDMLSCITGIDLGVDIGEMEVVYNLYSIPYNHSLTLKIRFERTIEGNSLPCAPSLTGIWQTANWHERETYDLMGVYFEGHPDLRRILLPEDWEGYPLRKDYEEQEKYHGIKVQYERD